MSNQFSIHTLDTAPEAARATLSDVAKKNGMIPNLFGVMAEAPPVLEAYLATSAALEHGSLSPGERQLLAIVISAENGCSYCVAVHSTIAAGQRALDDPTLSALRDGQPTGNLKLDALRSFALAVVRERGWVDDQALAAFLAAGYTRAQVLEVVGWVALKTLSNYTNHLAETPVDKPFEARRWSKSLAAT